jgi:hypothetical protein
MNIWDYVVDDGAVKNMAECRGDFSKFKGNSVTEKIPITVSRPAPDKEARPIKGNSDYYFSWKKLIF